MTTLVVKWLVSALAIFAVGNFLPGMHIPNYGTALGIALVLGIVNAVIRPILLFITLPINIITLGLFTFILNGFMFWLALKLAHTGTTFWTAVLASIIVSVISMVLDRLVLGADGKVGGN